MEIEVMLSRWNQCIAGLQESEQRIKNILSEVDIVRQQLRSSEDPAMILIGKKLEKQITELHWKMQTIRTMRMAMDKMKSLYLENEDSIEDGITAWTEPNPRAQVMPGFSDSEWFRTVQSKIRLKG